MRTRSPKIWSLVSALPLTCWVILFKSLLLFKARFPWMSNDHLWQNALPDVESSSCTRAILCCCSEAFETTVPLFIPTSSHPSLLQVNGE